MIQYSKRKNYEFVDSWGTTLQKATTLVREEKVKNKILRIFKIWEQREVYTEEFLADLYGLLNITTIKKTLAPPLPKEKPGALDSDEFQVSIKTQWFLMIRVMLLIFSDNLQFLSILIQFILFIKNLILSPKITFSQILKP